MLRTDGLTKTYSTPVVDALSMEFRAGEIHALLGANGAGKSTLVKMLAGIVSPTRGCMYLAGQPYAPRSKAHAEAAGVQIVQQELNLVPTLDVAENLFLNRLPSRWGGLRRRTLDREARRLLDDFGLSGIPTTVLVGELGVGQQQMLEIASNLHRPCQLLILDEPTAALSVGESELLFEKLNAARDRGVAIVYVSHRLDEVERLSDRMTVLRDGKWIGTWQRGELTQSGMVARMTGEETPLERRSPPSSGMNAIQGQRAAVRECLLKIRGLERPPAVHAFDVDVMAGEILGVAGLVGSGRTEWLRLVAGADRSRSGSLVLADGKTIRPWRSPAAAVRAGVVLVSEDRKADGLLLSQSIADNIALPSWWTDRSQRVPFDRISRWGSVRGKEVLQQARALCDLLSVRRDSEDQAVGELSGGNQQKVVLARWMRRGANVFLVDEPTRGIDVAARAAVHRILRSWADSGKGVVVVSSDLEELLEISDRIGVLSNGRWVQTFEGPDFDRTLLLQAMFSGYASAVPSELRRST